MNLIREPTTKSLTVLNTRILLGEALMEMRDAICTASPLRSFSRRSHSPVCSPARMARPRPFALIQQYRSRARLGERAQWADYSGFPSRTPALHLPVVPDHPTTVCDRRREARPAWCLEAKPSQAKPSQAQPRTRDIAIKHR